MTVGYVMFGRHTHSDSKEELEQQFVTKQTRESR